MTKYKLLAFDLDGTVMARGEPPNEVVMEALAAARGGGCALAVCTGRAEMVIPTEVLRIPSLDYVASANGALLRKGCDGAILDRHVLGRAELKQIKALARPYKPGLQINTEKQCFIDYRSISLFYKHRKSANENLSMWEEWRLLRSYFDLSLLSWARMTHSRDDLTKLVLYYKDHHLCGEQLKSVQSRLDVSAVSTMGYDLEITSRTATKGLALASICRDMGIDKKDVLAIGDSDNDLSMREYAGCLVAMGGASPALTRVADHMTESADDDGAARAIYRYLL